jgi:hypothetical protein
MVPGRPPALDPGVTEELRVWTCVLKFLGSGNIGAVFVPSMCSSKDLRVASALNCFSQASQSSGPFRVVMVDSYREVGITKWKIERSMTSARRFKPRHPAFQARIAL